MGLETAVTFNVTVATKELLENMFGQLEPVYSDTTSICVINLSNERSTMFNELIVSLGEPPYSSELNRIFQIVVETTLINLTESTTMDDDGELVYMELLLEEFKKPAHKEYLEPLYGRLEEIVKVCSKFVRHSFTVHERIDVAGKLLIPAKWVFGSNHAILVVCSYAYP